MLPSFCTFRSDTSPNLMRFSCSENRWSNGNSNIIFSTRPIQNEIKISFISKHTHTIRSGHHGQCIRANELFWMPCSVHCYRLAMCMEHGHGIEPRQQPQMIHMLEVTIENVHTLYENWPNAGRCTYVRTSVCQSLFRLHFHLLICTFSLPVHVHGSYPSLLLHRYYYGSVVILLHFCPFEILYFKNADICVCLCVCDVHLWECA